MPGYKTKLKKIFKIGNSQEKQIGLLDISRMRAKNKKIKKIFQSQFMWFKNF